MTKPILLDDLLVPGQKVKIARTITYTYEVDIADYLRDSGDTDISVEEFQTDQQDNFTISDIENEMSIVDILRDDVEVTEIV